MKLQTRTRPSPLFKLALAAAVFVAACGARAPESAAPPPPPVTPLPAAELLRRADEAYAARENPDAVREGLKTLRRISAVERDDYEAAWRASRLNYTLGDKWGDAAEREQAFLDGVAAGETATKVQPQRPEGHFWLGANLGGYAKLKGVLYGITSAERMRKEMEAVLQLDESFQGGSAFLALGQLDVELPKMLGGDPERAVATLEKGMRYGSNNALMHLRLAEAYLALRRKDEARREVNYILNSKPNPDYLPEHKEAVKRAQELLQKFLS
ncbi:MAG TPA: TRAP transporter TatT component family protein [Pyrinomonadaceae bacterium]|jgi:tetratricopeptide (TPR) repeat protein|nr:TRAP transporter TatT component family protein [Pyrinomonadaceae bacterium]